MERRVKKGIFLAVLMLLMALFQTLVLSAKEIDQMPDLEPGKKGTLSVTLSYKEDSGQSVNIQGVTLQAVKVADLAVINGGSASYTLTSDFEKSQIVFDGMDSSASNQAAKKLKAIALEREVSGQKQVTDSQGKVCFTNLEPGMYLVMQTDNEDTVPLYTEMDPYLVSVPMGETEDGRNSWKYEVETIPKTEVGKKPAVGSISITKRITLEVEDELILMSVKDATFYVGLFKDEAGTKPYSEDYLKPIHIVNASSGQTEYTGLPEGVYYIYEVDKNGTVIKDGEKVQNVFPAYTCIVEGSGEQKVTLDPALGNNHGEVIFNNAYEDLPKEYYLDAEIKIKKSVYKNDDRVNVEDTFYAGIFTKENGEYLLNQVVELKQNDTVTVPIVLEGGSEDETTEYWIFETDQDGKRVDQATFPYEVSGESSVKLNRENLTGEVEIKNRIRESEETEEPDETEKPSETEKQKETEKKDSVKTGDETPILMYAGLFLGAILLLIVLVLIGKKARKKR